MKNAEYLLPLLIWLLFKPQPARKLPFLTKSESFCISLISKASYRKH